MFVRREKVMYRFEITFGHRSQAGDSLPEERIVMAEQWALAAFSSLFRGAQLHRLTGGYLTDDGRFMTEVCTSIWSFCNGMDKRREQVESIARSLATELDQESVLLTIVVVRGTVEFIRPLQALPRFAQESIHTAAAYPRGDD
jgi:hypothetical protein